MALRYGFFNSVNGDRKYDALDMSSIFDGIIEDGIFATIGEFFAVRPGDGMQVIVGSGKAWFNHTWTSNDAAFPLPISKSDPTLPRYDTVVLEINFEEEVRANSLKVLSGAPSSDPQKPSIVRTESVIQHPLAHIRVPASATTISPGDIEIVVGKEECPYVTGPLETVPIDTLFARWEYEFDQWFSHIKTNLEGDVAANLQKQIDENYDKMVDSDERLQYQIDLIKIGKAGITVTVKTTSGNPLNGILVTGIKDKNGGNVHTNSSGVARGFADQGRLTLSITGYYDIDDHSESHNVVSGEEYEYEISVKTAEFRSYTTSQNRKFSKNVTRVDVSLCGGGGGGGGGFANYGGGGGGGGYSANKESVTFSPETVQKLVVGAGGSGGTGQWGTGSSSDAPGKNGGNSSFLGVSASGGKGAANASSGTGNGTGGIGAGSHKSSTSGSSGTGTVYTSITQTVKVGGGGGGGAYNNASDPSNYQVASPGGSPSGGAGGGPNVAGSDGTNGGGGGGGGTYLGGDWESLRGGNGGKGGNGIVSMRLYLSLK